MAVQAPTSAVLLLAAARCCVPAAAAAGITSTGCPARLPGSEGDRKKEFDRLHSRWPVAYRYPGKIPGQDTAQWTRFMAEKETNLSHVKDGTWRWEYWLEQAQIRILKNFTERGWGLGRLPEDLHERMRSHYRKHRSKSRSEGAVAGYLKGDRYMLGLGHLESELTEAVRRGVAAWAGLAEEDLVHTSTYGIREYRRGSVLKTHVDRSETHVLSAVYVLETDYDSDRPGAEGDAKPWYIVTDPDLSGLRQEVHVKPGELFFYESAKLPHGRPSVLEGELSAHVFVHFRPADWNFHNMDRVYALPPHWQTYVPGVDESSGVEL